MRVAVILLAALILVSGIVSGVMITVYYDSPWIPQLEKSWLERKIELYNAGFRTDVIKDRVGMND